MRTCARLWLVPEDRCQPQLPAAPLDFLGPEHAPELAFFPGMSLSGAHKRDIVREVIAVLMAHFTLVPMSSHAAEALAVGRLAVLEPGMLPNSSPHIDSSEQQIGLQS